MSLTFINTGKSSWHLPLSIQESKASRRDLLLALAQIPGVYVPVFYQAHYHEDGTFAYMEKLAEEASLPVRKAHPGSLPPPVTRFIVPLRGYRAQPCSNRDHAGLHARLSLLPCRHDHPPSERDDR
jgi:hypothetical protein